MKYLYSNKYWPINKEYNLNKILYLMIDRPNKVRYNGNSFIWENNENEWHRDYDFPAYIIKKFDNNNTCNLFWYTNNKVYKNEIGDLE